MKFCNLCRVFHRGMVDKTNKEVQYSAVMGWVTCCLSFSLLRSAIRCVRGSCSSIGTFTQPVLMTSVELIWAETGLSSSFDE